MTKIKLSASEARELYLKSVEFRNQRNADSVVAKIIRSATDGKDYLLLGTDEISEDTVVSLINAGYKIERMEAVDIVKIFY